MGNRKAPSPPPGSPGYKGPMQFKPTPPPPPPAKRGVTVRVMIGNWNILRDALREAEQSAVRSFAAACNKMTSDIASGRPKGKKR